MLKYCDMKKKIFKILLMTALILTTEYAVSQKYGISSGFNISRFVGRETFLYVYPFYRYNAGIFAEYEYSLNSTFIVELKYDLKGAAMIDSIKRLTKGYFVVEEKLNYITLPVLYKLRIQDEDLDMYGAIGASMSYLIKHKRDLSGFEEDLQLNVEYLFPFFNKKIQYDFILVFGMTFKKFALELRYSNSVTTQYNDKTPLLIRNNCVSLNTYFTIYKVKPKRKLW